MITAIILTKNEELHIQRCIENLSRVCSKIYVIDSYSIDRTCEIASECGAIVLQNKYINQAQQFQWALDNCPVETPWVMRMDADEYLTDELVDEICKDELFVEYKKNNKLLQDNDLRMLVLRHQSVFEEYIRLKEYEKYVSIDETKKELLEVKKELTEHPLIQKYYKSYYAINDLLEEVTRVVFHDISDDVKMDRYK